MEVAMPVAGGGAGNGSVTVMDSYEDMFKEITRKLYGEDGLPDLASGEKLTGITTSAERGLTGIDYDVEPPIFKPEEHITAFGLAALMQNGFQSAGILNSNFQQSKPSTIVEDKWISNDDYLQWTQSKIASYNPSQKLFRCADCDCVGFLARVAEHWLGTHANLRVFQCPQCPYASAWARCVRMHLARQHNVNSEENVDTFLKENPVFHEITRYLQKLKGKFESNCSKNNSTTHSDHFSSNGVPPRLGVPSVPSSTSSDAPENNSSNNNNNTNNNSAINNCGTNGNTKRYSCSYCPYATDRRDLFTRHENIHREEKPFQCYVCQKQFNRADHVKKHFLRMHREHPYDLNRIRRHPPKNASGMSYYHKYNNGNSSNSTTTEQVTNMQTNMQHPLTIPNGFSTIARVEQNLPNNKPITPQATKSTNNIKTNTQGKSATKKKGEKRYSCCYCSWSGVDNWCLKRHLNTHLKPFVCGLCDYKAARSERLATHVLKVHNKRACGRCLFLADDQAQLVAHQQEHHPLEQRSNRSSNNVLRNNSFNATTNQANQSFGHGPMLGTNLKPYELSAAAAILQHGSRLLPMAISNGETTKPWKPHIPKQHGAARLFNYMEASDGSEPECDTTVSNDEISRMAPSTTINQRTHSDFPEAGDVGNQNQGDFDDVYEEEIELPLFICRECGCEFVDDISLDTHQFTHHRVEKITTSPANQKNNFKLMKKYAAKTNMDLEKLSIHSKENLNPKTNNYSCSICKLEFSSQVGIMDHMQSHIVLNHKQVAISNQRKECNNIDTNNSGYCCQDGQNITCKRSRKQSQPRKVIVSLNENSEIEVKKRINSKKYRKWQTNKHQLTKLSNRYYMTLVTKKRLPCNLCKRRKFHTNSDASLAQHRRHSHKKVFNCDQCHLRYRHRYQLVLHKNHVHENDSKKMNGELVPKTKETVLHQMNDAVAVVAENHQISNHTLLTTNVPENSTYMEHTMLNTNIVVNNHIPIVIPTFPPT